LRRFAKLQRKAKQLSIKAWIEQTKNNLHNLLAFPLLNIPMAYVIRSSGMAIWTCVVQVIIGSIILLSIYLLGRSILAKPGDREENLKR